MILINDKTMFKFNNNNNCYHIQKTHENVFKQMPTLSKSKQLNTMDRYLNITKYQFILNFHQFEFENGTT